VTQIKSHAWDNTTVVLVGNKTDLKQCRRVDTEQGAVLAEELGMLLSKLPTVLGSLPTMPAVVTLSPASNPFLSLFWWTGDISVFQTLYFQKMMRTDISTCALCQVHMHFG
jgi:GTPase SAR1 family protein